MKKWIAIGSFVLILGWIGFLIVACGSDHMEQNISIMGALVVAFIFPAIWWFKIEQKKSHDEGYQKACDIFLGGVNFQNVPVEGTVYLKRVLPFCFVNGKRRTTPLTTPIDKIDKKEYEQLTRNQMTRIQG